MEVAQLLLFLLSPSITQMRGCLLNPPEGLALLWDCVSAQQLEEDFLNYLTTLECSLFSLLSLFSRFFSRYASLKAKTN